MPLRIPTGLAGSTQTSLKTWLSTGSPQARALVRHVLRGEETLGLHRTTIYQRIMQNFPDAKEDPHNIAPQAKDMETNTKRLTYPPNPFHPVRSLKYLKHVVLIEMLKDGEVEEIRISHGTDVDSEGRRLDTVHYKATNIKEKIYTGIRERQEYRWRLAPPLVNSQAPATEQIKPPTSSS